MNLSLPCSQNLIFLFSSGERPWLPLSMSTTGILPLLCLAPLPSRSEKATSLTCLISGYGDVLPMCICRRTRDLHLWVLTWRSVCLLGILLGTRGGSSTILLPGRWSSQRGQISMRDIILASRELILLHHLSHSLSYPALRSSTQVKI